MNDDDDDDDEGDGDGEKLNFYAHNLSFYLKKRRKKRASERRELYEPMAKKGPLISAKNCTTQHNLCYSMYICIKFRALVDLCIYQRKNSLKYCEDFGNLS